MKKLKKIPENHQMSTLFDLLGTCGGCGPCGCEDPYIACYGGAGGISSQLFIGHDAGKQQIFENYMNNYGY